MISPLNDSTEELSTYRKYPPYDRDSLKSKTITLQRQLDQFTTRNKLFVDYNQIINGSELDYSISRTKSKINSRQLVFTNNTKFGKRIDLLREFDSRVYTNKRTSILNFNVKFVLDQPHIEPIVITKLYKIESFTDENYASASFYVRYRDSINCNWKRFRTSNERIIKTMQDFPYIWDYVRCIITEKGIVFSLNTLKLMYNFNTYLVDRIKDFKCDIQLVLIIKSRKTSCLHNSTSPLVLLKDELAKGKPCFNSIDTEIKRLKDKSNGTESFFSGTSMNYIKSLEIIRDEYGCQYLL